MAVFLERMVMPRSRSRSLLSMIRSDVISRASSVPDWRNRQSTSVVLPWSTCAIIAILRRFSIIGKFIAVRKDEHYPPDGAFCLPAGAIERVSGRYGGANGGAGDRVNNNYK